MTVGGGRERAPAGSPPDGRFQARLTPGLAGPPVVAQGAHAHGAGGRSGPGSIQVLQVHSLPLGPAPRRIQPRVSPDGGTGWCGLGWGSRSAAQPRRKAGCGHPGGGVTPRALPMDPPTAWPQPRGPGCGSPAWRWGLGDHGVCGAWGPGLLAGPCCSYSSVCPPYLAGWLLGERFRLSEPDREQDPRVGPGLVEHHAPGVSQ